MYLLHIKATQRNRFVLNIWLVCRTRMVLVKIFVKCLEQQRPDWGIWRVLKRKGYMSITCQDFYAFIAIPEQVVELRTAITPLGCLQRQCVMSTRWPVALLLSVPLTSRTSPVWKPGSHLLALMEGFLGKALTTTTKRFKNLKKALWHKVSYSAVNTESL